MTAQSSLSSAKTCRNDGPDGFPAEFYQNFSDIIKSDLLELFNCLHVDQLDLFRLNFGEIVLLPKIKEAERIQQYRPICLLNVSFKIFTKVATNRLNPIADHVVRPSQTAFMQGRNILPPFLNTCLSSHFNKWLHTEQNEWIYTLKYVYIYPYVLTIWNL